MNSKRILINVMVFSSVSLVITVATYFVNIWLFSSNRYLSPTDAFFVEGVIFLLLGFLLFLGRGGINLWSQKAAILSAWAEAAYDADTVGPAEQLRRDKWKPKGLVRMALILILAGIFMILTHFLTL